MRLKALAFTGLITTLILTFSALSMTVDNARAANNEYSLERVNRTIEVMYNGYVFINDTVYINGTITNGFLTGFPYRYGSYVLKGVAYNSSAVFPVDLNVPLKGRMGFYGVEIDLPHGTQVFNVGFILSNSLLTQDSSNASRYTLDFPAFPSFAKHVDICNVSILLPTNSEYISSTVENTTYIQQNLQAFADLAANLTFSTTNSQIQLIDITQLKSEIKVGRTGEIQGTDTYRVASKAIESISSIEVTLPENASVLNAHDQLKRNLKVDAAEDAGKQKISLRVPLETGESSVFAVEYHLPSDLYISPEAPKISALSFPLFQHLNCYVHETSASFVFPEGARILDVEHPSDSRISIDRGALQETLTVNREKMSPLDKTYIRARYEYDILWASFRPTLWMWALTIVGCAIAIVWRRPRRPIPVTIPSTVTRLRPEDVRSFIDAYEKKKKIASDLESLKNRARKGRISRRRYRVQRKTLETRLVALSRKITDLKESFQAAGGRHRDFMRRLEIAETEINEVEANIESIEGRHRRGELSLGAYRKLLADYKQRKEKGETTINEILIRLREEAR